jgi:hypothetical protein
MPSVKRLIPILVLAIVLWFATSIYTLFQLDRADQDIGAVSAAAVHSTEALADLHSDFDQMSDANQFVLDSNNPAARETLEHGVASLDAHFDAELTDFDEYIAPSASMHRRTSAMRIAVIRFRAARDEFMKAVHAGAVQKARGELLPGGALDMASKGVQGSLLNMRAEMNDGFDHANKADNGRARVWIVVAIVAAFVLSGCASARRYLNRHARRARASTSIEDRRYRSPLHAFSRRPPVHSHGQNADAFHDYH